MDCREMIEQVVKLSPIVISAAALFVAAWTLFVQRKHNRLSVKPALDDWTHEDSSEFYFQLFNKGLGTAKLTSFEILLNDKAITSDDLSKLLLDKLGADYNVHVSYFEPNSHFAKDEERFILKVTSKHKDVSTKLPPLIDGLQLKINYESLYGDTESYESLKYKSEV